MNRRVGLLEKLIFEIVVKKITAKDNTDLGVFANKIFENNCATTFVNPYNVSLIKNCDYLNLLRKFDNVFVDGMLLKKAIDNFSEEKVRRLSFDGNSLAPYVFNAAKNKGVKLYFLGGEGSISKQALEVINSNYQFDIVVGASSGFFRDLSTVIEDIKRVKAGLVIVGMGAPLQDAIALEILETTSGISVVTCGGYFDQIVASNEISYYPRFVERLNLRYAYRLYKEPSKMIRRYVSGYMDFYVGVLGLLCKKLMAK